MCLSVLTTQIRTLNNRLFQYQCLNLFKFIHCFLFNPELEVFQQSQLTAVLAGYVIF